MAECQKGVKRIMTCTVISETVLFFLLTVALILVAPDHWDRKKQKQSDFACQKRFYSVENIVCIKILINHRK